MALTFSKPVTGFGHAPSESSRATDASRARIPPGLHISSQCTKLPWRVHFGLTIECVFAILNAHSEFDNMHSETAMKSGQRRERTLAHARTDIVEAAIAAFARVGLHATTMQDIAREAGYTAASLYTYFKSKQEIVDAVLNLLTDEYIRVFDEPLPSGLTFYQRFELVLRRQLEQVEKRRNVFTSFIGDDPSTGACGGEGHRTFHSNFERRAARLAEWFKANAKPEDLGGYEPDIAARLLFGMAFGLLHRWGEDATHSNFIDFAPVITDFFFHGVGGKPKTGARKK
jgi:AcrR family transcriptional regulator